MKVAIIGASGNTGTELLRALAAEPTITDILGVARRRPDVSAEPYAAARWETFDIGTPARDYADEDLITGRLAELLSGCTTVVHLAWLIQPNHRRRVMRRTNVTGTRRVVDAAVRAGVEQLVVASSIAAYSGVDDDVPRDESWQTDGSADSAHYAVDKAAQERILDRAERDHPGLRIARVRPALVFRAGAGAEIARYFLGAFVPTAVLRPGVLPVLPVPSGIRVQVVHGSDLADAYRRIIVRRSVGAFNVAAEPVLQAKQLAGIVDHGRYVQVPAKLLRPLIRFAWTCRTLAPDPGWLDMAMRVPVMDSSRARDELDWAPQHDANQTLGEMLAGIASGQGEASAPLRPRRRWPQDQSPPGSVPASGGDAEADDISAHRLPDNLERDVIGLYLSDHLTGATAGLHRAQRMARAYRSTEIGPQLADFADDLHNERGLLADLIDGLELRRRPHRQVAAAVAERLGRLKFNGRINGSPMTPLLEVEIMRSAVVGKLGGWQTLGELAPDLGLPAALFASLAEKSRAQIDMLGQLHGDIVRHNLRS